jgi:hypothetical protein
MDETELQLLLSERSGTERRVYEELRTCGKMTDRQLRDSLHSPGSGPRDALRKLWPLGLVRPAGKAATKNNPMQWEVTPVREIEEERKRYDVRDAARLTKRKPASPGTRLAGLRRQMEQGDVRQWYPNRDRILAALPLLSNTVRMSFWESVPPDELRLALDEIEELHASAAEALEVGRERLEHEKYKAKIEKLGRTKGRTVAEQKTAARKATNLRRKLISS